MLADNYYTFRNLEFRDGGSSYGIVYPYVSSATCFVGCLFHQDNNKAIMRSSGSNVFIDRCIMEGTSDVTNTNQCGINTTTAGFIHIKNSAIYGMGDYSFYCLSPINLSLENVNLGIELLSRDVYFHFDGVSIAIAKDVSFGSNVSKVGYGTYAARDINVNIENYNRVLGAHKRISTQGEINKVTAGAGGDVANARSGGATNLIEINFNKSTPFQSPIAAIAEPLFVHEFEATTDSKSYRYYVQSMAILTAAQLWIEVEYVNSYDDTTEYVFATQKSDETFTVRADADDWAEYMEVTGIQPAVGSKVRIKCYCSYYHATNKIYIDPKVVIS